MDENANAQKDKKVDESWKNTVEKEKCSCGEAHAHDHGADREIEVNFPLFVSGLMMEGAISLGEVEHPVTHKKEANIPHAKFIMDTLAMLQEKTKNNLTKEEADILESILYELRMRFVAVTAKDKKIVT